MIRILLAALALVCVALPAEARHSARASAHSPECNVTMPCDFSYSAPSVRREEARVARGRYVARQMGIGAARPARAVRVEQSHSEVTYSVPTWGGGINRPTRYIAGRLICAVNVGSALAERGIRGTGSALALSYLHWGRSAGGPVPGAVIVSSRRGGGHVAIVSRVENGIVYAWNATGGQSGWREIPYRHRVLDYRVPG